MFDFLKCGTPEVFESNNYVVLDFETDTSHGDYGHPVHPDNKLLLSCWKCPGGEVKSIWGGEYDIEDLIADINDADFIVAHNAKYELGWLCRAGLDMRTVLPFDTKLAEYVLLGNLAAGDKMMIPRSTALDACIRRRGGVLKDPVIDIFMKHGHNPVDHPRAWLEERCKKDVKDTEWLFLKQRDALRKTNRLAVLYTRCILTPALAEMEFEGMRLDPTKVNERHEEYTLKKNKLSAQLDEHTGGINWRSTKQLGEFLYDQPTDEHPLRMGFKELTRKGGKPFRTPPSNKYPEGQRKTDDDTLNALKATTKRQRDFIALRSQMGKVNAALSKSLDFFKGVCDEKGGVFNAVFNQANTATHRLSSSGIRTKFEQFTDEKGNPKEKSVQFQNMARIFKDLLMAKEAGWQLGEWDGSQLEFRVAAFVGNDAQAKKDILSGHDVHNFTATKVYGIASEDVSKTQRQDAKEHTFKPLYGGTQGTKAEMAYYEAFKQRYPDLAKTQAGWVLDVVQNKRMITPWGLRFYWPKASVSRSGWVNVTSAVFNYPIQCLATAEIIPIALVYFWHHLRRLGLEDVIRLVNTVHDSVICEIAPGYEAQFEELSAAIWLDVYAYLRDVYKLDFDVTLGTEVNIGTHWAATGNYEQAYDINPNGSIHKHGE